MHAEQTAHAGVAHGSQTLGATQLGVSGSQAGAHTELQ